MVKFVLPFTWVVVSVLNLLFDLALFIGDLRISGCFDWWRSENRKKHFSPFITFSSFRMSCYSVIDDSLIDVRSFQFAEMIKLFVLSELDIPVFYWGQTWTWTEQRVTSIFAKTDESRPDLNISPLIAHLQTPLKISETIYIDKANIYQAFAEIVMWWVIWSPVKSVSHQAALICPLCHPPTSWIPGSAG